MKFNWKLLLVIVVGLGVIGFEALLTLEKKVETSLQNTQKQCTLAKATSRKSTAYSLKDRNSVQIPSARKLGLAEPLKTRADAIPAGLVEIQNSMFFRTQRMYSSRPYLTAETAAVLKEIGETFQAGLQADGLPTYTPYISSALRSLQEQKQLRKRNGNASRVSAHFYGTTFDISYKNWYSLEDPVPKWLTHRYVKRLVRRCRGLPFAGRLSRLYERTVGVHESTRQCIKASLRARMRDTLTKMRKEGKIWALEEKNQPCFHVTLRKASAE